MRDNSIRVLGLMTAMFMAASSLAADNPPLAAVWNIAPSGHATSDGVLRFRLTRGRG